MLPVTSCYSYWIYILEPMCRLRFAQFLGLDKVYHIFTQAVSYSSSIFEGYTLTKMHAPSLLANVENGHIVCMATNKLRHLRNDR